jgi:hypothetical protein
MRYTREKLPCELEQKGAHFIVISPHSPIVALNSNTEQRLSLMYNPLVPWNAWFALSSQAARICLATQAGMLRGIARAGAKAETETDRMVTETIGSAAAARTDRVAKKSMAVGAKAGRRNRRRVRSNSARSGRVEHRIKKIQKRRHRA